MLGACKLVPEVHRAVAIDVRDGVPRLRQFLRRIASPFLCWRKAGGIARPGRRELRFEIRTFRGCHPLDRISPGILRSPIDSLKDSTPLAESGFICSLALRGRIPGF